jgi:hypothetical protein
MFKISFRPNCFPAMIAIASGLLTGIAAAQPNPTAAFMTPDTAPAGQAGLTYHHHGLRFRLGSGSLLGPPGSGQQCVQCESTYRDRTGVDRDCSG